MRKKQFLVYWMTFFTVPAGLLASEHSANNNESNRRLAAGTPAITYRIFHANKDRKIIENEEGTWIHLSNNTWLNIKTFNTYAIPRLDSRVIIRSNNIRPLTSFSWLASDNLLALPDPSFQVAPEISKKKIPPKLRHKS
ncbi:MAG: hypothetical protein LBR92_02785 [Puniceicoccales bacterium]|jgi:hypothetical protein|nr:hypothetical protein [Puniceicoccales bacterium]